MRPPQVHEWAHTHATAPSRPGSTCCSLLGLARVPTIARPSVSGQRHWHRCSHAGPPEVGGPCAAPGQRVGGRAAPSKVPRWASRRPNSVHVFSDAGQSFSILTTFVLVSCVVTTADLTTAHPLELPQARWLPVTAHTSGAAPGARAQHTAPGATAGQHTTRAAHTRLIHLWSCTHASLRWAYAAIAP